ncbi:hypothetical protein GCM10023188_17120 [Pontibacter saemangeumensis]|uniref:Response regulatory domain-containing protein n=1 Tax=Pontibacter saemangeumensis TaxID=1084525 RepID=A0ABP8LKG9_9BACT
MDDDKIYLYTTERLLKRVFTDVEILSAPHGAAALAMLRDGADAGQLPQLIISDIDMPLMDGLAFIRELERLKLIDFNSTKLVLNSNSHIYRYADKAGVNTAVTYIQKPITKENLLSFLG